jgi:hypothetical protein
VQALSLQALKPLNLVLVDRCSSIALVSAMTCFNSGVPVKRRRKHPIKSKFRKYEFNRTPVCIKQDALKAFRPLGL